MNDEWKIIIKKIEEHGFEAYIVGGCLRDIIMGKEPEDIDITTSAPPDKILQIFDKTIPTGIQHGTVTVIYNNTPYEITTFRSEGRYSDNRHPDTIIFSGNITDDLKRRDFTINAMCYNNIKGLIDPYNGRKDVADKIIRSVNNPYERFKEDSLRILRGIRFAALLNFSIEEKTFLAMRELSFLIKNISGERIFNELNKMFEGRPFDSILLLKEIGFFKIFSISINTKNIDKLKQIKNKCFCSVVALIIEENDLNKFLNLLKCSNKIKRETKILNLSLSYDFKTKLDMKKFLYKYNCKDIIKKIIDINDNEKQNYSFYNEISKNNECFLLSELEINGNDLIKLGIQGKEIKNILEKLLERVIITPELNSRINLLEIVKEDLLVQRKKFNR